VGIKEAANPATIKVANVIEESRMGGPQNRIISVASSLYDSVKTVVVMPKQDSKNFQSACKERNIQFKTISITRLSRGWLNIFRFVLMAPIEIYSIYSYLKKNDFDIVHISGGSWQFKGAIAAKIAGVKIIWHLNDTSMPYYIRLFFKVISPIADAYIYASNRTAQYYKNLVANGRKEFNIPAPVDTQLFNPLNQFDLPNVLSDIENKIIIGMVANLNPIKGVETYIKVIGELNKKFDNLHFLLAGNIFKTQVNYFNKLSNLMKVEKVSNLEFMGEQKNIGGVLKIIDIYVCTSNSESSPLSVWEAMSMSKPIIATDVGDISQYIIDGYNGYIVNIGDSTLMAKRVEELIINSELRKSFGERSRAVAVNFLSLTECSKKHLVAYRNCLAH